MELEKLLSAHRKEFDENNRKILVLQASQKIQEEKMEKAKKIFKKFYQNNIVIKLNDIKEMSKKIVLKIEKLETF